MYNSRCGGTVSVTDVIGGSVAHYAVTMRAHAVFHIESRSWELHAWEPKILGRGANTRYIVEFIFLEGGNLGWGWKIPGPPTLSMKPWHAFVYRAAVSHNYVYMYAW